MALLSMYCAPFFLWNPYQNRGYAIVSEPMAEAMVDAGFRPMYPEEIAAHYKKHPNPSYNADDVAMFEFQVQKLLIRKYTDVKQASLWLKEGLEQGVSNGEPVPAG